MKPTDPFVETGGRGVRPWRMAMGVNALVSAALALAVFLMLNYLSFRHFSRWDWSRQRFYSLSEKTQNLLAGLTNAVDVRVIVQPGHETSEDIGHLLAEYEAASPWVRVERVDPDRDLARTEELGRRFKLDRANLVVFEAGGRSRVVPVEEVLEMDYSPIFQGQAPARSAFRGEWLFSSAIHGITQGRRPVLYVLQGHGERDLDNYDRVEGYSGIAQTIQRDNIEIRPLVLGQVKSIPEDADALLIAGPSKPFSSAEVNVLDAFLKRNGRILLLLDAVAETGLEDLLADWGIDLGRNVVVDATRTLNGRELFVTAYPEHPITRSLRAVTTVFYLPRSVEPSGRLEEPANPADRPQVVVLASCTESGWAESDMEQNPMAFDAEVDMPGPVAVAVAVERGPVPGFDVQIKPVRMVVVGDSDFAANGGLVGGNADFFMSALNWLLEREQLMGIAAKPFEEARLLMSAAQLRALSWGLVAGLPGLAAVWGLLVWLRRRR